MPYLGAQVIFKHYVSKDGNLLSLSNILQLGIQDPYESPTILNMGITFKDNSPEEIAEACLEMERWVEVGTPVCAMTDLQNRVMDISKAYTNYQINVPLAPKVAGSFLVRNPHWVT
jgi:hypothetical protein